MKYATPSAILIISFISSACSTAAAPGQTADDASSKSMPQPQAEELVRTTWRSWCDALLGIGAVSKKGGDARAEAERVLSTAYAYDDGTVLFKPTLASGEHTFRFDKAGALAYFVGNDPNYPEDHGFALKGWTECSPEPKRVVQQGTALLSMGNVHLTGADGKRVSVDKTFGYARQPDGSLKIVLHHSSLPYAKD